MNGVRGGRRRGFSLIEVLVVISVLAVLVAVLLPGLAAARAAGRAAVCMAMTRQIADALWMYEADNEGYVPREGTLGTTPSTLRDRIPWNVALRPYLDERCAPGIDLDDMFEVAPYYRCPAHPREPHRVHFVANGFAFLEPGVPDERGTNNPNFRRGPTLASLFPFPASTLYLTDLTDDADAAMYTHWLTLGNTDLSIGQCYDAWLPKHLTPGSGDFRIGPRRHGRGATALYLDAHAAHQPAEFFLAVRNWDDCFYARP